MRKQRHVTSVLAARRPSGMALLMDPVRLAKLIIDRITKLGTVTYDQLLERSKEKNIEQGIFDNAIQRVHKKKTVLVKNIKGILTYSIKPVVVKKTGMEILDEWRKANPYPYPKLCTACKGTLCAECYPFYNPDTDTIEKIRASLMMTREEYKAVSEGRTFIPKRKKYEYVK